MAENKREWGKGRTKQFNFRMTPAEKEALETVASRVGMCPNEYVRYVLANSFQLAGIKV